MKKTVLIVGIVAAMLLTTSTASTQKMFEFVDSIEIDSVEVDTIMELDYVDDTAAIADTVIITQHDLSECDKVDICRNPKYAIVTMEGKKGVYDMDLHENVTEIEFQELEYSHSEETDDHLRSSWFHAKRNKQKAIICVYEDDNSSMAIWMGDLEEE